MAYQAVRKPVNKAEHFDLLPFIALMMIVLATLLFITMSIASINIGAGAAEGWIPSKSPDAFAKIPILVEWDGQNITVQNPSGHVKILVGEELRYWWNSDWNFKNPEMRKFLEEMIDKKETHYVLFAVRPSGFENFQTLASEFRDKKVEVGYEPIEQDKTVRLKLNPESIQ